MSLNAYLKLKGQKQGDIKGSVTQKGREGQIKVFAVSHEIESPTDMASGLPTGQRRHTPFIITKELDRSTPLLYNLFVTNENITNWELQFWAPQVKAGTGVGAEVQDYTVQLTNARIVKIDFHKPDTMNHDLVKYPDYEDVSFVYEKITWIWKDGNVMASDDWEARV